tara:strand:+ start:1573 stop:2241 length:669 start_codon:yes stop_codon:yes gene_type:complete
MRCLIFQPAGLGDVLFLQKIATTLFLRGYEEILFPLLPGLLYIKDYVKTEGVSFLSTENLVEDGELEVFNFRDVNYQYPDDSVMKSKYKAFGVDYSDWSNFVSLERNLEREEALKEQLNIPDDYCLVNRNYGTPPNSSRKEFKVETQLPVVEMAVLEGYNLFDWCGIIANANEIYTVETALNFLVDLLPMKATKLEQYSRHDPPSYFHVEGLFKADWNYNLI